LILLAEHCAWTGKLSLVHELRDNAEAALRWIDSYAIDDRDGYIDYQSANAGGGLINQGWKDSGDAIVSSSGALAEPPVALVEVQAYAYLAKLAVARLVEHNGEHERAKALRQQAQDLRERFNRDFWLEGEGFLALGLHGTPRAAIDVISSNPGHALFSGIVPEDRAELVAKRLMADDMYSGWGIRTLSMQERAYNPVGYHLGTVWPHDSALALAGFRRYGFDKLACRVFTDLLHAATFFEHDRLPEAFAGFERAGYGVPVRYPVACHPQAWAAGSVPFMLTALLGLMPDALERRLTISRPCLPPFIRHLELSGLRVGDAEVDLRFERSGDELDVQVQRKRGELEIVTETQAASP
jgi:glycogen debranching enzyme